MSEAMVRVENLWKHFGGTGLAARWRRGVPALQGVGFTMREGELASLVGESGSGKTTIGRCLMGLIRFDEGTVRVNGYDVGKLSRTDEHAFRMGAQMVFQNPYASLNPAFRVRDALTEAVRVHDRNVSREEARAEVERLAQLVQLPSARLSEFPSSLSGGERRRVVFARALATRPRFVVTDEPVSGLDQPIQAQLLDLLRRIHERQRTTMLFISHDLRLVRFLSDRVLVILRGRLVEDAPASIFFSNPAHPYSQQLRLSAFKPDDAFPFAKVHKAPPRGAEGCPFRHRCQESRDRCSREMPRMVEIEPGHRVACHRWGEEKGSQ